MTVESIANNPILTLSIFTITLIGFFLTIFFYINSKREKILCYFYRSNTLIEGINEKLSGLQLNYNDLPQERITITKFILWNNGKQTIDYKDVVLNNPLRLKCSSKIDILDIQITKLSENSNTVKIKENIIKDDHQFIEIEFDFLDHKDFIKIQFIHNGKENELFELTGKVKGIKKIRKPLDPFGIYEDNGNPLIKKAIYFSITFIIGLIGLYNLIVGHFEWYFWYITCIGFFGSGNILWGYNYLSPEVL